MTTHLSRRVLARSGLFCSILAAVVVSAVLPAVTATAATGALTYTCSLPLSNSATFSMNADTNAPAQIAVDQTITPTLHTTIVFPASFVSGLRGQGFTAVQGTAGTASITTNGSSTPVDQKFAKKNLPTSGSLTVVASGTMATTSLPAEGTITYKPGQVDLTLHVTGSASYDIGASCPLPAAGASKIIDTVQVGGTPPPPPPAKASSRIGTGVGYVKATKKLTVAGKVFATPAQVVTGNMNFSLYKAGKRIRNVTVALKSSAARKVLSGKIGKGTYSLKITYYGSPHVKGSTATRKIVLR